MTGAITDHIDVAQLALYAFWIFFFCLVIYLRREDRREGYPLYSEPSGKAEQAGFIMIPAPKVFRMFDGRIETAPRKGDPEPFNVPNARPIEGGIGGSPLIPLGDPMVAGIGPGSWVKRANVAELNEDMRPRISPMRISNQFYVDSEDPDPRGMTVVGADGVAAGTIRDIWVDRSEYLIRYLEIEVSGTEGEEGGLKHVLLPMTFAKVDGKRRIVKVESILGRHFTQVPVLADPDQVTLREEDRIMAFYGAGTLYAEKSRAEPLL